MDRRKEHEHTLKKQVSLYVRFIGSIGFGKGEKFSCQATSSAWAQPSIYHFTNPSGSKILESFLASRQPSTDWRQSDTLCGRDPGVKF
jgi:hypothetical protein